MKLRVAALGPIEPGAVCSALQLPSRFGPGGGGGARRWCCARRGSGCGGRCCRLSGRRGAGDDRRARRRCCLWAGPALWRGLPEEPGDIVALTRAPWRTRRRRWRRCRARGACAAGAGGAAGGSRGRWTRRSGGRCGFCHLSLLRVLQARGRSACTSRFPNPGSRRQAECLGSRPNSSAPTPELSGAGTRKEMMPELSLILDSGTSFPSNSHRPGQRVAVPRDDDRALSARRSARRNLFDRPRADEARRRRGRLALRSRPTPRSERQTQIELSRTPEHARLIIAQYRLHPPVPPARERATLPPGA